MMKPEQVKLKPAARIGRGPKTRLQLKALIAKTATLMVAVHGQKAAGK